jgi:hypothetical protein
MTGSTIRSPTDHSGNEDEIEEFAGGSIKARRGHIPLWLLCVYTILFFWSLYYIVTYWGGFGPGRVG